MKVNFLEETIKKNKIWVKAEFIFKTPRSILLNRLKEITP